MIFNNYQAMQFIRENKNDPLTPSLVFELQRILTHDTLDDASQAGRFRRTDEDINVVDNASHIVLHEPPPAHELPQRLQALCDFANADPMQSATPDIFFTPGHQIHHASFHAGLRPPVLRW